MRENNRKPIEKCRKKLPQFTTMNVIDGQAGLVIYSSLIFYSLTIDNILNIIVLLILAGVTIATLVGDNGILTKANEAVQTNTKAEEREKISLAWQSLYMRRVADNNNEEITGEELEEQLIADGATGVTATGSGTLKVTFTHPEGDNIYTVNQDGNIMESKWYTIAKEDRTVITDGETELYIGDYVAYDEQVGEYSYTSKQTENGYGNQIYNLNKNDVEWRVLGLDENTGELLLVAANVIYATDSTDGNTDQAYRLSGQAGYQYGVDELKKICEIFGHGNGATGARSITVEDINKITGYKPEEAKYGNNQVYEYGNKVTYYWQGTNYPYYEAEDTEGNRLTGSLSSSHSSSFNWYDEESKSWKSSPRSTTATSENKEEITTLTSNYYNYSANKAHTGNQDTIGTIDTASEEYKTLFGVSTFYWLASPYVNTHSSHADFGLRTAFTYGYVSGYSLYYSHDYTVTYPIAVRPVVSLKSDISIVGGEGTQGEGAYQIQ